MSNSPRVKSVRRDWGSDDSDTPILHVDMDSFYAEVELLEKPELRAQPVVVGGRSGRGVVTSANYPARAYGVRSGMPVMQARRLCPQAHYLPTRHSVYEVYSARVMRLLGQITPRLEQVSIDEAYLDVSGVYRHYGSPVQIAKKLRALIRTELDLPASVGIGNSKLIAKIASGHAKPDGLLLVPASSTTDFLHLLPVGSLPGVGAKSEQTLRRRGIETVADLAAIPLPRLRRWMGDAAGFRLFHMSRGVDRRQVVSHRPDKSLGAEVTLSENTESVPLVKEILLDQSHQTAARLRSRQMRASTVSIRLRDRNFRTITRSRTLSEPTDLAQSIYETAVTLALAQRIPAGGYRLIGVRVENLRSREQGFQIPFDDDQRRRLMEVAMDEVRSKYGVQAVIPASLLNRKG